MKEQTKTRPALFTYTTLGRLIAFNEHQCPIVEVNAEQLSQPLEARSCVKLSPSQLGAEVILLMTGENNPVITGVIEADPVELDITPLSPPNLLTVDGHAISLKAAERISIQCGETSITLTKEGKITLRGKYLLSRAKKANRIQGGSVELN
ncbi:DUF6484 domain-containing protein [Serratia silvae]|uniref:DUF6484 domain-containing protein n=1 Tax=Serratia silvae TaxID=2824122 RepID=A0ABT0KAX9_9GAMM|nr:DUF6484 domain-containing protein [Serratia silvae]MCL1029170.1 hypothetical protein [Serratia silvae]